MSDDGVTAAIPLHDRRGIVIAYAIIDTEDIPIAGRWRWCLSDGYAVRGDKHRRIVRLHRDLLGLTHGDGIEGDHIDLNRLNNRRSNLRIVSHAENMQNIPAQRRSSSQYRGVSWSAKHRKWTVRVRIDGKSRYLGLYATELEAAEVARTTRAAVMPYAETNRKIS